MDRQLLKNIAHLSVPAVVTNITTPLLALSDTAITGHLGGAVYLAAIALGGTVFNMLYWLCGFLRMGSSGLTAQAYGSGDRRESFTVLARALMLALALGLLMILFRRPIIRGAMLLMDGEGLTLEYATLYFSICIWGAPATLGMFSLTGWCVGMQNSRLPMYTSIFIDVLNIGLSVTLVFGFHLGITGVATGTLVAQWSGFLLCLWLCRRRYGWMSTPLSLLFSGFGRFFRINADIFLRTLCLVGVTIWFTRIGASQGPVMLAVNALLMQLFTLFSFFMDGMAFSAEALCGRYLGSADHAMLRRTIRYLMRIGVVMALVFTVIYMGAGEWILGLLCDDATVLFTAKEYMIWAISIPLLSFSAFLWDGVFIGLTRTRSMLLSMAIASGVFFGVYAVLYPRIGNHGLWIAFLSYLAMRGIVLSALFRKFNNRGGTSAPSGAICRPK